MTRRVPIVPALVAAAVLLAGCGAPQADSGSAAARAGGAADTAIVAEARAFMDAYARDLLAGDRAAIAARYDSAGAWFLGNGQKELLAHDAIAARYDGPQWQAPKTFEWRDLSFEPVGPDAIVVMGTFAWGAGPAGAPVVLSYASLLRRRDGALRIRMEDESVDPTTIPREALAPRDSAGR